ncbi:YcnI family protein [Blastococcus capsensis]|uniref:YcnI family protein n=1 Tax=Blastococcus capsensis TaxID=1564163 RepID=UPI0025401A8F|nr:YcnI family protein [Blastococcus capsensis]MDK3256342.1 YcnI family protein [Blastococcus capsensis]
MSRTIHRLAVVLAAVLTTLLALAGVAAAHVSVSSQDAEPGGYGKLTFRVPNESDTASTVALRISIPEEAAMASLRAMPLPGWNVTMTTEQLDEPLEAHGQDITGYVSVVEFRAEDGAGIGPGEFGEFALSGGPLPDAETLSYPVVQTYSDGSESAWIEPTVDGAEPESPAPVLALSGDAGGHDALVDAEEAEASADASADAADGGSATATTALVLAIIGVLAGIGGLALGWAARRRTASA